MRLFVGTIISAIATTGILAACGGDVTTTPNPTPDSGTPDDDSGTVTEDAGPDTAPPPPYPAFKVDAPQVVSAGGPVMKTPKLVPVYFQNDDTSFTAKITDFLTKLPASTYWPPPTTEYGVGTPTTSKAVQLSESAPAKTSDADIQAWLGGKLNADDPAFPKPDANTLYLLYYPTGTTISDQTGTSCQQYGGYHSNLQLDSKHGSMEVAYAVMPRCKTFGPLTGIDVVTGTSSHEIIEAASDPFPQTNAAYGQVDTNHIAWMFFLGGGENGDMCAQFEGSFYKPSDLGYYAQRSWSNIAAKAGHDPCVPAATGAYFNTMPVLTDTLNVGGQFNTKGVKIAVGSEKTIPLQLFSDAPTNGDWLIDVIDGAQAQGQKPQLQLTLDKNSGHNGDVVNLTIKVLAASQYKAEGFLIRSTLGNRSSVWVGLVGN